MLSELRIQDFAIIDEIHLKFHKGFNVLTGETGAGKSIMLDALGLCLGDRADPKAVRAGCKQADITAIFDISDIPQARDWLAERDLVTREEFDAVRAMAEKARAENEALAARIAELEKAAKPARKTAKK